MITLPFTLYPRGPGLTTHVVVVAPCTLQVMGLAALDGDCDEVAVLTDALEARVPQPELWARSMASARDVRVLNVRVGSAVVVAPKEVVEEQVRGSGRYRYTTRVITARVPWFLSELGPTTWPWPAGVPTRAARGAHIEIEAVVPCAVSCRWLCQDDSDG